MLNHKHDTPFLTSLGIALAGGVFIGAMTMFPFVVIWGVLRLIAWLFA